MSDAPSSAPWTPGTDVALRFIRLDGSHGAVHPLRVVADDGAALLGWLPLETPVVGTRLVGGGDQRAVPLDRRFTTPREQYLGQWQGSSTLRLVVDGQWSSVWWFFAPDGRFTSWYVNLEIPLGRTLSTVDRCDGALDVVIEPDRAWRWKDEDEADACVAAGRFTADHLARLRAEGERMIALAEAGVFPFDGSYCDFRPDPAWPSPELPGDLLAALPQ